MQPKVYDEERGFFLKELEGDDNPGASRNCGTGVDVLVRHDASTARRSCCSNSIYC